MKKDIYRTIAIVTGIFMLTVTIMLTTNYFQVRNISPLQTEVMETLKSLNETYGDNTTLQEQIRQLDLLARKAYFVQEEHQKVGVYLLIAMSIVFIACIRGYYADVKHIAPKQIDVFDEWLIQSRSRKYIRILTGALAAIALFIIIDANRKDSGSTDADAVTDEVTLAEQADSANSEASSEQPSESETLATVTPSETSNDENTASATETPIEPQEVVGLSEETASESTTTSAETTTKSADNTPTAESAKPAEASPATPNDAPEAVAPSATQQRVNHQMFRGRNSNGHSSAKSIPSKWDLASGGSIKWKETLSSKQGFSSPIVHNDRIFFTGGDASSRELYCHDLASGKQLWSLKADNIAGSPATPPQVAGNTGYASATAATDGKHVCAIFATGDIICSDFDGKRIWAKNLGVPENQYGFVSSLVVWGSSVFVQFDNNNMRKVVALDIATGNVRWQKERDGKVSWSSPIIATVDGNAQLILMGNPNVTAYNPSNGEVLWSVEGMAGEVCPSPCSADGIIYAANEYAKLMAINGKDGSVVWEAADYLPEVSSPVVANGKIYIATSYGVLAVYNAKTGEMIAEKELNVELYSSPMVVEGKIYIISKDGQVFIFSTDDAVTQINSFATGEATYATPAFLDGMIVIRTEQSLYCVADK